MEECASADRSRVCKISQLIKRIYLGSIKLDSIHFMLLGAPNSWDVRRVGSGDRACSDCSNLGKSR